MAATVVQDEVLLWDSSRDLPLPTQWIGEERAPTSHFGLAAFIHFPSSILRPWTRQQVLTIGSGRRVVRETPARQHFSYRAVGQQNLVGSHVVRDRLLKTFLVWAKRNSFTKMVVITVGTAYVV